MAKKHFNWIAVIVLVLAVAVLAVTALGIRNWQQNRTAAKSRQIGLEAYKNHIWETAAKNLGRFLAVDPHDIQILFKYADSQLNIRPVQRGNIQQAIAAYRTILRTDKNNQTAVEKLVGLYLQMRIDSEAELIAERFLQTNANPNIRRMLAISLANQRKTKKAVAQLETIIEEYPEQISAYETLAQIISRYPEDFSTTPAYWLNQAVKNNSTSPQAYISRAAFYLQNQQINKAVADLETAEKLDLSDSLTHLRLAAEFANANLFDKAQIHLAEVQAQDPNSQLLWQTWAAVALKTASKEQMFKVAQTGLKTLALDPWDFMPLATELFIRCGEFEHAADCLDKLKQKDIAPPLIAFLEGLLAEAKKQDYKAILEWHHARQLGDKSEKTQLALAAAYHRTGDYQSAVAQLRNLTADQPYLFRGHLQLARLLAQAGNWAEAVEQAHLAVQLAPDNLDALILYIQARLQLNKSNPDNKKMQIWQETEKQLTDLENLTGSSTPVKFLQLELAMQRKKFAEAEQLIENLKTDNNFQFEAFMAEIDLLVAQDKIEQAVTKLYALTKQFPQVVFPVKYLANLLAGYQTKEDCETVLKKAMQSIEDPAAKRELALLLADFYDRLGQNDRSCQLISALSKELPYDIPLKRKLLKYRQVIKNTDLAQQLVIDIKTIEGEKGWQWRCEQAKIWLNRENFEEHYPQIIALLKENLAANPDDQISRMLLAAAYEKAGELHLAVVTYRQALNRSPENVQIIVPAVSAMYKAKEYEQADKILMEAVKHEPIHPDIHKLELQSYLRQGKLSSAESVLEDLMANDPNDQTATLFLALLKIWQNKYEQANTLLNKLKTSYPEPLVIAAAMVEMNVRQKNTAEALALCDEMVKQYGSASAYILRGNTCAILGQNNRAKEDFERATFIDPNNVQVWVSKSNFNRSIGELEEAVKDIQKALSLDSENLPIQKLAVALLLSSGEPDKTHQGRKLLDDALSSYPADIELRLYKARCLLTEGTAPATENAQNILQKISEEQPKLANVWALWAQTYLKHAQQGKALDIILRGLAYSPDDKTLLLLKARLEASRAPALAIPTLKVLNEREPDDSNLAMQLADTYIAAGQYEQGISILQNLLARCGEDEYNKLNTILAIALYKNGSKAEAEQKFNALCRSANDNKTLMAFVEVLKEDQNWDTLNGKIDDWFQRDSNDTDTFVTIARNLAATKNDRAEEIAENLLRRILNQNPNSLPAMNTLAMLLQATGQTLESAKLYKQIIERQPDAVVALNNLAWIMCEEQNKYSQALELAQQGLQKAPEYTDLIDTRGVIYYRSGEYYKAVQDFTKCIELYAKDSPSLTASHFHLARAWAALRQNNKALENLRTAMELNNKIGGLSPVEITESQILLEKLLQEQNHVPTINR